MEIAQLRNIILRRQTYLNRHGLITKLIEELRAKLAKYENPHTPSSAQRYKKNSLHRPKSRSFSSIVTVRRIKDFALHLYSFNITPKGIPDAILRVGDVDAFIEQPGGKELSEAIHEKFKVLKGFIGKDPPTSMEERKQQKEMWAREMAELAEHFSKFTGLKKPVTYIRNGLGNWYTCLLYPGMEPTNNLSEQVIREHVLIAEDHRHL